MTVQDLINKALQLIGVIAAGETPATEESNDAFDALNNLVASWNAQQIPLYSVGVQTVTLTGAASYPLTTRPARIKSAEVVAASGASKPCGLADVLGWTAIDDKTRTGIWAETLYCDYGFPTANVFLSPRPAAGTLELYAYVKLAQFTSLTQTIALPDGYERALRYALAVELAPEYGRAASQELIASAGEAKSAIAQLNAITLGEARPGAAATAQPAA